MKKIVILSVILLISYNLYSQSAEEYLNSSLAKVNLQDYRGAISDCNKAIEIEPNYALAYNNRGKVKYKLQDYRGAISDYNKAIVINPNYALAYENRGLAKFYTKDFTSAIDDFTTAININPNDKEAYYGRGLTNILLGNKNKGCLDLSKAGELGHENAYNTIKEFCQ